MSPLAAGAALALLSSFTTAIAHAMLKSGRDVLAVRAVIGLTATVAMAPLALFTPFPTQTMAPWLLAANAIHAVYQLVLVKSYGANDFAVAYPLARGVSPIGAALIGAALMDERLSPLTFAGIGMVSTGMIAIVLGRDVAWAGVAAALLAGALTTAYTAVDATAIRLAPEAAVFIVWFFLLDGVVMTTILFALRGRRAAALMRAEGRKGVVAGVTTLIAFGAALFALALAPIGVVSALRETSVVFAVAIAALALKEKVDLRLALAAALVATGAILTIMGLT